MTAARCRRCATAEPAATTELTDADLVARARDGVDTAAFEELVRRHRGRAYRVALRVCGNSADAEDVAQDAFVRAWRALPGFRGDAAFTTWLYRIVTNLAVNRVRRRREDPTADPPDPPRSDLDPAARIEAAERLDVALAALAALTPEQRACFVLREVEGLPYEEIAEVLETTVAAVKQRLFRARAHVAAVLSGYDTRGDA